MFDGLIAFGHSIWSFCDPLSLGLILLSSLVGVVIGALPGLTATMGVALMTTLTIKMPSNQALLVLICTYVGAIYGGSRSAILLNIPGTPASAASCLDGHALAKQGHAGRAMGIATSGSVLGTLIGMFFLALFTPILGNLALKFGAYEFFWLALFGVIIAGTLTGNDPLKGWIAGLIGIFTASIGQEAIYAYDRFSFGSRDLAGGLQLVPALVGAFGFAELLMAVRERPAPVKINPFDSVIPKLRDVTQYWRTIVRSGVIGTFIGILPGVGEDVAAWSSYAAAKRASKEKEKFGKGSIDGLMAAETGDNACVPGAVIPVLTLAVPGSAPAAVLMAAMLIHGVRPGPMIMIEAPTFVYDVVAMMMFATIGILIYGLTLTNLLIKVLMVPKPVILPIIFVLCVVGSYAISQRLFDVWVMMGFGVLGYAPAPTALSGGAAGARHGARRPDGEGLPARARAVRRRSRAVLHAPDFRGAVDHHRAGHPVQVSHGCPRVRPADAARGAAGRLNSGQSPIPVLTQRGVAQRGNHSSRRDHERRHRPHGHEPASRPVDQRDPPAGRCRARIGPADHAGSDPGRPQCRQARRAREGARRRALDHRSRRRARRRERRDLLRQRVDRPAPGAHPQGDRRGQAHLHREAGRTDRSPTRSTSTVAPKPPGSGTASCRTSCGCRDC